jgi:hypothetical protein
MRRLRKKDANAVWYRLELTCRHTDQFLLRSIILSIADTYGVEIRGLEVDTNMHDAVIKVRLPCRSKDKTENFMKRFVVEPTVNKISWELE